MRRLTGARPYNHLVSEHRLPEPDRPWVMRTYAGHSTARESNELYRRNLAKGQTGLSVAFDLPTQTGYDPDHELARGEVGKVGVSIAHKADMHALLDGIPLDEMNTSMTINATAAWLLALYMTVAWIVPLFKARRRTTSSRSSSRAGPTRSRPSPRCG
jgi:methylmalonyl-CoA mutase cobalamin-binding domain/chain